MDEYLEFVLFNWKNFPRGAERDAPVSARFVIREDGWRAPMTPQSVALSALNRQSI